MEERDYEFLQKLESSLRLSTTILPRLLDSKKDAKLKEDTKALIKKVSVDEFAEAALSTSNFAKIKKEHLRDALTDMGRSGLPEKTYDVEKVLKDAEVKDVYGKADKAQLAKHLKDILGKLGEAEYRLKSQQALSTLDAIRPGDEIKGVHERRGSICCFLINDKKEIFLVGDAHVLVDNPLSSPGSTEYPVKAKNGAVIAKVVWHTQYPNSLSDPHRDIGLAKVYPQFCKFIQLKGRWNWKGQEQHFDIIHLDTDLQDGMVVHLLGANGQKTGKIKSKEPRSSEARYGSSVIMWADLVEVEPILEVGSKPEVGPKSELEPKSNVEVKPKPTGLAIEGDSGGLWVNNDGKVLGMQITGGETVNSCFHPISVIMKCLKNYDASLRLLLQSEVPKD